MSEQQLQFNIVKNFRNKYPEHRGMLFEINNSTNKGAHRKGLGQVKGASDLFFLNEFGKHFAIELKEPESRHDVSHLIDQCNWLTKVGDRGGLGFFIFTHEDFENIIEMAIMEDPPYDLESISIRSIDMVLSIALFAQKNGKKTVKLPYNG